MSLNTIPKSVCRKIDSQIKKNLGGALIQTKDTIILQKHGKTFADQNIKEDLVLEEPLILIMLSSPKLVGTWS